MFRKDIPVTLPNIEIAYKTAAQLVARYGDGFLPIFERLHQELEQAKAQDQLKRIALEVAKS